METENTPHHVYLGGKLGFIYGSLSALAFIFGFFMIPETRQLELEEIDKKFIMPSDKARALEFDVEKDGTVVRETPK